MARVTFEGKRYPLLEGESVLQALLRGGATIPFSCRKGTCQSCMLRADEGDPGLEAQAGLRPELADRGYFLPCQSVPTCDVVVQRPDPKELFVRVHVQAKEVLAPDVVRLFFEPETTFVWRPGQFIDVRHPEGLARSYSLASLGDEGEMLEIHVKRLPGGRVSGWLADQVAIGDVIDIQGPLGECVYDQGRPEQPLLLLGTGTGLSPLLGIVRDALLRGHQGEIFLYHGAREPSGLYLQERLETLAREHENFHYVGCLSGASAAQEGPHLARGRVTKVAFARHPDLSRFGVYLCGLPGMVDDARHAAYVAGADRADIHADPFDLSTPFMPDEATKLAGIAPDPELWEALGRGKLLRAILEQFYTAVYEDPRLVPFFHKITKERAIDKQYAFLADVFTGGHDYFGLKPFNAHHWMVISDELFDYRERLIEGFMRKNGLPEHLIRRWCAVQERFRREIVKGAARGLIVDGVERLLEGFSEETLTIACVCDGCGAEMPEGTVGRMHQRTAELFCTSCSARKIGATLAPPAPPPSPPAE